MKTSFITSPAALMAGLVAMSLLLAACGDKSTAKDDHGSKPSATVQAHDEPETLTQFTDKTELFLEFPPLVVGPTRPVGRRPSKESSSMRRSSSSSTSSGSLKPSSPKILMPLSA